MLADISNTDNFNFFKYKTKLLGNTEAQHNPNEANGIFENVTIAVPLKYLSNFWRSLNCKVELKLKWTKYGVLSAARDENVINNKNNNNNNNNNNSNSIFTIKDTKLYVPVATLSGKRR